MPRFPKRYSPTYASAKASSFIHVHAVPEPTDGRSEQRGIMVLYRTALVQ